MRCRAASARREFGRRACRALHYGLLETPAQTPSGRTASQSEVAPAAVPCSVPFRWFAGTSTGQRKARLWRISRSREFVEFRNSKTFRWCLLYSRRGSRDPKRGCPPRSMPARASRRVNAERTAGLARSKWRKCQCPPSRVVVWFIEPARTRGRAACDRLPVGSAQDQLG